MIRSYGSVLLIVVSASLVRAQTPEIELPRGLPVGPWILAPSIFIGVNHDDNLFRQDEAVAPPAADRARQLGAAIEATLPFRQSLLRGSFEVNQFDYQTFDFSRDFATDSEIELDLGFSTGDRLRLSERFTRDFIRLREITQEAPDIEPEEVFFGEPVNVNRITFDLDRSVLGRQGYRVRVQRRDSNYKGEAETGTYDYRGFESLYEFRQPVRRTGWIIFHYDSRRFNHYDVNDPVGVPFRKEETDSFQVGWRSDLGKKNPYLVRFGYERLRYKIQPSSFSGLSGFYFSSFALGSRNRVDVALARQSLPSSLDSYYINNSVNATWRVEVRRNVDLDVRARTAFNDYGPGEFTVCGDSLREDWLSAVSGEMQWGLRSKLQFSIGGSHERRRSNCDFGDYDDTEIHTGFRLGWY